VLQCVAVGFTCADVCVNNITQTRRTSRTLENVIVVEQSFMSQRVAVSCSVLQCVEVVPRTLEDNCSASIIYDAMCCSELQCAAVC